MKKFLTTIAIVTTITSFSNAQVPLAPPKPNYNPAAMFGVVYNFHGNFGLTLKIVSSNEENNPVLSGGVSYYPKMEKFTFGLGGGYVFKNGAATLEWDFINSMPELSVGYVNTKDEPVYIPAT